MIKVYMCNEVNKELKSSIRMSVIVELYIVYQIHITSQDPSNQF